MDVLKSIPKTLLALLIVLFVLLATSILPPVGAIALGGIGMIALGVGNNNIITSFLMGFGIGLLIIILLQFCGGMIFALI